MCLKKYLTPMSSIIALLILTGHLSLEARANEANEFLDMDLSQLMQITITSVSKRPEQLSDAAAAVYVITQEVIQQSGVTTIQDALRLAPGVQVAQIGADKWAVTSRGFNGRYSNKLLVLMDGRTVYSPAFAGVYWEMQNTLLEDIARIEIIRGPGATLWGANAVNGVINIITKTSHETKGGFARLGVGTEDNAHLGMRYGWSMGEKIDARVYGTYDKKDSFSLVRDGSDAYDDWESGRAGFRVDGDNSTSSDWTIQGDVYENSNNQLVSPFWLPSYPYFAELREDFTARGWNILGRFNKYFNNSTFTAQLYFDKTERDEAFLPQQHDTFDLDLNYQTKLGSIHEVSAGLGFRSVDARFMPTFQAAVTPSDEENINYSGYIQDAVTLLPESLIFTFGTKWEKNEYTDQEWQPSLRLLWKAQQDMSFWAAVSRAVKVPSQVENGGSIVGSVTPASADSPAIFLINGSDEYESEEVVSYETGYRWFPNDRFSFDLALFYNDYDMLLDSDLSPADPLDAVLNNNIDGYSYGAEIASEWQPQEWLTFNLSYSFIKLSMESDSVFPSINASVYEGSVPTHMISLLSRFTLSPRWSLNVWLRYVDELENASITASSSGLTVDDYVDADLVLSFRPMDNLNISLVGQNLLHSEKLEFVSEYFTAPTEIERNVYFKCTYTF